VLVMKSTVPVGTGLKISSELARQEMSNIDYVSNPEFLREGSAIHDFLNPDRVVIGSRDPEIGEKVARLYRNMKAPILKTNIPTAEMIKYASNAFLATKISFINEIANVCEEVGADVCVVADGMGRDSRIGKHFLNAGIGFGGSCFPKDVTALKQIAGNSGYHFQLLTAVSRSERTAEAASGEQTPEAPGDAHGQDHRPAGAGFQTQYQRPARGFFDRAGLEVAGRRRPGQGL
ncbi:MAG: nucleotide sugar dehydrogenase, partial [Actinobacteria bacterium]|nr:nucleotide sugar dehydrogenase [Actinomycetota bacterium]